MMRIGVIGCGGMATKGHGPALADYQKEHPDVQLAACCDIVGASAKAFAGTFGFANWYTDPNELIAGERLDALCLYVRLEDTAGLAVDALKAGIPVLLEKPPGVSREECLSISDAHTASGLKCMVAFNRRYMPLIRETKELLGSFDPFRISCTFLRNNRTDEEFRFTAIHGLDTIRHLGGSDYAELRFDTIDLSERGPGVRAYRCVGSLDNGIKVDLFFNQVAGVQRELIEVYGLDRSVSVDLPVPESPFYPGRLSEFRGGSVVREVNGADLADPENYPESAGFAGETRAFLDSIRTGGPAPAPTPAEAMQSLEVANALNDGIDYRRS